MKLWCCRENKEEEDRQEACSLGSYVLRLVGLGLCVQMFGAGLECKAWGRRCKSSIYLFNKRSMPTVEQMCGRWDGCSSETFRPRRLNI